MKRKIGIVIAFLFVYLVNFIPVSAEEQANKLIPIETSQDDGYAALKEQEKYIVAYSENHAPYTYQDSLGNPTGMAIDIMNYMATLADIQVEYVSIEDVRETEECVDISLAILEENMLQNVTIKSEPYFYFPLMAIGKTTEGLNENILIGHLAYIGVGDEEIEAELLNSKAYIYGDYEELENALKKEDLDYMVVSSLVANQFIDMKNSYGMYVIPLNLDLEVSLLFRDDMEEKKIEAFNLLIENVDEKDVYAMMLNAAVQMESEQSLWGFAQEYKWEVMMFCVLFIIVTVGFWMKVSHDKRVILVKSLNEDLITGLVSERKFYEEVASILEGKKEDESYSMISIDIDNFKYINDVYGYDMGTKVLKEVAEKIQNTYTSAVVMSRIFADKFLILAKKVPEGYMYCGKKDCEYCMEHALQDILGEEYHLYLSIGVYHIEDATLSLHYIVDCANMARIDAKKTFGNTYGLFTKEKEKSIQIKNEVVTNMQSALMNQQFIMLYQPKINLQSNTVVGAEALVRWIKTDGSQIYPDSFIPIFEENGFIIPLDYYIFHQVCRFLQKYSGLPKISINLSGITLLDDKVVENIIEILMQYDVGVDRIEIEITESAIVENDAKIIDKIDSLRKAGFTVAMDDFGAGVSSLNRLKDISLDVIKMDKAFLGDSSIKEKEMIIIKSMIEMSKKLSIKTVAEGVETKEQAQALCHWGCDIAQGYYFARPLSEESFIDFCEI